MIPSQVTHVVCEHLPLGKLTQITSQRRPPHIVRPEWLTCSVAQGKRLLEFSFRIPQLLSSYGGTNTSGGGNTEMSSPMVSRGLNTHHLQRSLHELQPQVRTAPSHAASNSSDPTFTSPTHAASSMANQSRDLRQNAASLASPVRSSVPANMASLEKLIAKEFPGLRGKCSLVSAEISVFS